MQLILLTRGKSAVVSDEDAVYLCFLGKWTCNDKGYATSGVHGYMHLVIARRIGLVGSIDHEDRDSLNNQRYNLRLATKAENNCNRSKNKNASSQYKGVSWHSEKSKWVVYVQHKFVGYYDNELDAALAYDKEAKKCFGIFSALNFPGVT